MRPGLLRVLLTALQLGLVASGLSAVDPDQDAPEVWLPTGVYAAPLIGQLPADDPALASLLDHCAHLDQSLIQLALTNDPLLSPWLGVEQPLTLQIAHHQSGLAWSLPAIEPVSPAPPADTHAAAEGQLQVLIEEQVAAAIRSAPMPADAAGAWAYDHQASLAAADNDAAITSIPRHRRELRLYLNDDGSATLWTMGLPISYRWLVVAGEHGAVLTLASGADDTEAEHMHVSLAYNRLTLVDGAGVTTVWQRLADPASAPPPSSGVLHKHGPNTSASQRYREMLPKGS